MSKEEMVAEFGEPGVQNAKVIDLITVDATTDTVVLVMVERRPWGAAAQQFRQIEEKINRYLGYVLDGFLIEHHPQYKGKAVRIRLDCAEHPHGEAISFVQAAAHAIDNEGLQFEVTVPPPPG
jgi:hypothetical protein